MNSRIKEVESLLDLRGDDDHEVRTIGIWGMGGIGKTTVARQVFEKIKKQFECKLFVDRVRENSGKNGLVYLQKHLYEKLLDNNPDHMHNVDEGKELLRRRLRFKKVLIVLDDVDDYEQITALAERSWLGPGSRVIITTRDKATLIEKLQVSNDEMYEVKKLSYAQALQLFNLKAFDKSQGPNDDQDLEKLSNRFVEYAGGLPLAITVLGSYLKEEKDWTEAWNKLRDHPEKGIDAVLQVSFSGLNKTQKEIFLDIACFFKGEDEYRIKKIFAGCDFYPENGFRELINKCLITIENNQLWMHDLLQQMGRNFVHEESPNNPGQRSRLWVDENEYKHTESWHDEVLTENTGTNDVKGLFLTLPEKEKENLELDEDDDPFSKMRNLRLLKICNASFSACPEYFCKKLRLLEWHEYPLKSLPSKFRADQLVELKMPNSSIQQLWDEKLPLMKVLRLIDLSNCRYLSKTPDLSKAPKLEELILEGCTSLESLPPSINLESLKTLTLSGCSKLKEFPEIVGNMENLAHLKLDGTAITDLPMTFQTLKGLILLSLTDCKDLYLSHPSIIGNLTSLQNLNLSGCSRIDQLPDNIEVLENLQELDACRTAIREVPSSITQLKRLKMLCFHRCKDEQKGLQLPKSFFGLSSLRTLGLGDCGLGQGAIPDDIGSLSSLHRLDLNGNEFTSLPESISQLSELRQLQLFRCSKLESLPKTLPEKLTSVDARDCSRLKNNSNNLTIWASDRGFCFIKCGKAEENEDSWTGEAPLPLWEDHVDALFPKLIKERIYTEESFEIRFPHGATIPNWCSKHWGESSATIPLFDPEDRNREWIGFAIFVVFELVEDPNFEKSWELKKTLCHFETPEGRLKDPLVFKNFNDFRIGLSYALCCYQPRRGRIATKLNKASRQLTASVETYRLDLKVKGCAIRLIFNEDVADHDAGFICNLSETANNHLDLNFGRHCQAILNEAMKLEASGCIMEVGQDLLEIESTPPMNHGSNSKTSTNSSPHQPKGELELLELLLSLIYEGCNGREKNFHFSFPYQMIVGFFDHYVGDVALCHLPQNLMEDQTWIGLDLYVLITWSSSKLSNDQSSLQPSFHVDLSSPKRNIWHKSINLLPSCQLVVLHTPRSCFSPHELNQCEGLTAIFRTSTPDVEVRFCGSRLVYDRNVEELIKALAMLCTSGGPEMGRLLFQQVRVYVETMVKSLPQPLTQMFNAKALDEETRKLWQDQLLSSVPDKQEPEQFVTSRLQSMQYYRGYFQQKQGVTKFNGVIVHSKQTLLARRYEQHVVEEDSKSVAISRLHVMAETQLFGSYNLANWKKDVEYLLEHALEAILTLKGHTISLLHHFSPAVEYNVCFPQKKILGWFDGQTSMSSRMGIELPPKLYDDKYWRGLVVCAAFSVHEQPTATLANLGSEMDVKLVCHLRIKEYCLNPVPLCSITKEKFKWLHLRGFVWLTYLPRILLPEFSVVRDVEARIYSNCPGLSVENCGVRLLYQKDVEVLKTAINQCWTSFFDDSDLIRQFLAPGETVQPSHHADHIMEKQEMNKAPSS